MEELHLEVLQGRWGSQIEYAFRYPQSASGRLPFDGYWRRQATVLQYAARRERGQFPTVFSSEWQLTRQDERCCSGFLDISRKTGYQDWSLWRISATFTPTTPRPIPLSRILNAKSHTTLQDRILEELGKISAGETPFFRGWQRRAGALLHQSRFYLTGEGLCLWFPQGTLAPKNAGIPSVHLPYDTLDILRPLW